MKEYFEKFKSLFHSPGLKAVYEWSACVHFQIVLLCVIAAVSTLWSLCIPLATRGLVDGAVGSNLDQLRRSAIIMVILTFGRYGLSTVEAMIRIRTNAKLQKHLQGMMVSEILAKEYPRLKSYHSGELVNRVFSDIAVIKGGIMGIVPNLVGIAFSFIGATVILISMDWRFVFIMVVGGLVSLVIVLLFKSPLKERHKRMQEAEDGLHASMQETLENVRLIKSGLFEERMIGRVEETQETLKEEQIRQGMFSFWMRNIMGIVFDISWLVCMIWGCVNIYHGVLTYGTLAAMIQLIGRIQSPIANSVGIASSIYSVSSSAERLLELTDLPDEEEGERLPGFDRIEMDDVSFIYEDGREKVLRDVDLTIKRGDFMALTGISGGGKTSLFQLILGIYKPTSGSVCFCEGDKKVPACRSTRELFSYVPQGNTLFSGTLRENIMLFTKEASEEQIEEAVRAACLEDVVESSGMDDILGERGTGLSEGQAQRVAIARALLSGAPILLLDEATSALDEATEAKLLDNISHMRDKTCIIVTHRRAALSICDYTVHIEDGTVRKLESEPGRI